MAADESAAAKLYRCSPDAARLAAPGARRLAWAGSRWTERTVTPVTRRELRTAGPPLRGPLPADLLPAVTGAARAAFVRAGLRGFRLPAANAVPAGWTTCGAASAC
ncbi:hypothetical protein POF50_014450 [Streptomyces sp. SL13]|uniref:Uncharacterized protein n=1 Tax=Streptantibioticus silvisoli TaxID=2705255 RepID=A0AA90K8Z6_9ACTN|nr:hypothetical protein [Streptantibioticus silvisoli]MDI5970528.1 hypothetical protein [Streptantibioticus silvisoli]